MSNEEAIKILKEVREEVLAKETELSKQVFENLGIKAIDLAIKAFEQQQEPSEDCISRQVVKEMLTETWTKYMPMELDINLSFVLDKISELPPVTPQPKTGHWIPVSERLPRDSGYYLTTTMYDKVYCDYWEGECFNRTEAVIAWMPLPEPYKAESEEKE